MRRSTTPRTAAATATMLLSLLSFRCSSVVAFRAGPHSSMMRTSHLSRRDPNTVRPLSSSSSGRSSHGMSTTTTWQTELSATDLTGLAQTAEAAARAAGQVIVDNLGCASKRESTTGRDDDETSSSPSTSQVKTSIKDIVTEHDKKAQIAVEGIIRAAYPNHSFLGEEDVVPGAAASEQALTDLLHQSESGYLWICDPIDGTANFASGLALCGVTVSVVYRGTAIVGVIYDPHADEMFTAVKGQGATVNGQPLQVAKGITGIKDSIINAGCPADPQAFAASMRGIAALNSQSRGLRMIACSALTTAWIAAGRLTAHFGYDLSSWDLVAGALLIQEAGGLVTDLDGSPYRLETRNMLCSNGLVHEPILDVLKEANAVSFTRS